ncbi:hypothetical protein ABZ464_12205 [Streptomyces sp. NPDC005820]|uniref:hypothetical protein n=1 Tax=Streptomyces sp. NPDC005820 TaxID=3157069 RepID=UPI00340FFBFC
MTCGRRKSGFTEPRALVALGVAVAAPAAFVLVEAGAAHPMVPLEMFRDRTVVNPVIGLPMMIASMVALTALPATAGHEPEGE